MATHDRLLNAWIARIHKLSLADLLTLKKECQKKLFAAKPIIGNLDLSLVAAGEVNKRIKALQAEETGEVPERIDPVKHFAKTFGVSEAEATKYIQKHGNPFPEQEGVRKPLTTASDLDYSDDTTDSEPEQQAERKTRKHAWGE